MSVTRVSWSGLFVISLALASPAVEGSRADEGGSSIVEVVRDATHRYRDVANAIADGYAQVPSCVSGPEEGAMGVHYVKGSLFDGQVDATAPEALVYEPRQGRLHLVAVEYIAPADAWHASHEPGVQPSVLGQLFHYVPGPNRYGPAAFYELHVWAWKPNPNGTFADWNPRVSCAEFQGETSMAAGAHAH
jgi:hypothetical protein